MLQNGLQLSLWFHGGMISHILQQACHASTKDTALVSVAETLAPTCLSLLRYCLLQKQRGHQKHDFFKKTKHGQPVMKYRVDKILAVLEREKEGKS